MAKFECEKCGACCHNLLVDFKSWKLGLFLLPDEVHLFPADMVFPMWGINIKGRSRPRPEIIGVLQLNANICPHLKEKNVCEIYQKRPAVCRAHPLSITMDSSLVVSASIDIMCPFSKRLPGGQKVKLHEYFDDDILKANAECCGYLEAMFKESKGPVWLFDLTSEKWKRIV